MAVERAPLEELSRQLAELTDEERERLFSRFARQPRGKRVPIGFKPRVIKAGTWSGGTLSREELYGGDGR